MNLIPHINSNFHSNKITYSLQPNKMINLITTKCLNLNPQKENKLQKLVHSPLSQIQTYTSLIRKSLKKAPETPNQNPLKKLQNFLNKIKNHFKLRISPFQKPLGMCGLRLQQNKHPKLDMITEDSLRKCLNDYNVKISGSDQYKQEDEFGLTESDRVLKEMNGIANKAEKGLNTTRKNAKSGSKTQSQNTKKTSKYRRKSKTNKEKDDQIDSDNEESKQNYRSENNQDQGIKSEEEDSNDYYDDMIDRESIEQLFKLMKFKTDHGGRVV